AHGAARHAGHGQRLGRRGKRRFRNPKDHGRGRFARQTGRGARGARPHGRARLGAPRHDRLGDAGARRADRARRQARLGAHRYHPSASPMNWTGAVRTIIVCAILIVLHYTLRPLLAWRASIDFLVVALLIGSVRLRPGTAALYGFLLGLVSDSLSVSAFGAAALAMSVVGFAASWLKAVFFADNLALNGFFLFLAKWLFDLIFLLVSQRASGAELAMQLFVWSPLSAAVTAVAGVVVLSLLKPLMEVRTA